MKIKLVVSDMDGTLLNDNHQLPADFFKVEQQLKDKGIVFAVASGRQYYNLYETMQPISERLLILADNGTIVKQGNEELFINPLDANTALKFIITARNIPNAHIVLCGKNAAYIEDDSAFFIKTIQPYFKKIEAVADLTQVSDTLLKVSICDFNDAATNSYIYFKEYIKDYKVAISSHMWLDITCTHANKGVALQFIQKKLGISPDETLVFGDYFNDLEMLQNATHSYAMQNAHPEIIKIAKQTTRYDNNNNGVLDIIKEICL